MKTISIMIPCYNEEENVKAISEAVIQEITTNLPSYDYEILFIDNDSSDHTREYLREICAANPKIKAIFNAKNFGQFNSPYYGICQTSGDCTICLCCDFQDPVEMIPRLVEEWEKGAKIVCAIKTTSKENKIMRFLRTCYYKMIKKMSDVEQIEHFTGFGLYDKGFVDVLRNLDDPTPFLRGIVAELGYKRVDVAYEQQKRRAGKTHNNLHEGRTSSGNYCGIYYVGDQSDRGICLSDPEAPLLGPLCGRYDTDPAGSMYSRFGTVILYRISGRICVEHQ